MRRDLYRPSWRRWPGWNSVWLADPSLGNRTCSREQLLRKRETRSDDSEHTGLRGKFLAVLPLDAGKEAADSFFSKTPQRQTAGATKQLLYRPLAN